MAGREARADSTDVDHDGAAAAFVRRVKRRELPGLQELFLFGSTARGTATGLDSDVDVLVTAPVPGSAPLTL